MSVATGSDYETHDKAVPAAAVRPVRGGPLARALAMVFGSDDLLIRMAAVRAEEIEAVKRTGS